jgi:hypothetical protein
VSGNGDAHRGRRENFPIRAVAGRFDLGLQLVVRGEDARAIENDPVLRRLANERRADALLPVDERAVAVERDDVVRAVRHRDLRAISAR